MIKIEKLSKKYDEHIVLPEINLDINKGDVVSIIGPSGAGKSTLLRCINMLEIPTSGNIYIDERKVSYKVNRMGELTFLSKMNLTWLRTEVGMVFQQFNLWPTKTVLQNITEGLIVVKGMSRSSAEEFAMEELQRVGLKNKANAYPGNLSGGQQQRVAIARALAMQPKVILFDEPTSALDPELVKEVLDIITEIAKVGSITMLVVTHEMNFARYVGNRVLFMEKGNIIMDDTPDAVFECENERMQSFFRTVQNR